MTTSPIALMIVGGQKCGTSSLLRYLGQHSRLYAHQQPECTFFLNADEYASGWQRVAPTYFDPTQAHGRRLIAKCASLMYSNHAVERLAAHNPDIEVVVLLRDPVQRAYSAYLHARRKGFEYLRTFEEALWASPARLHGNRWGELSCSYLSGGEYVHHVKSLLTHFPRERVYVLLTEDLRNQPSAVCHTLFAALGVPTAEQLTFERYNTAARPRSQRLAHAMTAQPAARRMLRRIVPLRARQRIRHRLRRMNEVRQAPAPLNPTLEAELRAYFHPLNAELAELLDQDLADWAPREGSWGSNE